MFTVPGASTRRRCIMPERGLTEAAEPHAVMCHKAQAVQGQVAHQAAKELRSLSFASAIAFRKSSHVTACPSWRLKYRSMPFLHNSFTLRWQVGAQLRQHQACTSVTLDLNTLQQTPPNSSRVSSIK